MTNISAPRVIALVDGGAADFPAQNALDAKPPLCCIPACTAHDNYPPLRHLPHLTGSRVPSPAAAFSPCLATRASPLPFSPRRLPVTETSTLRILDGHNAIAAMEYGLLCHLYTRRMFRLGHVRCAANAEHRLADGQEPLPAVVALTTHTNTPPTHYFIRFCLLAAWRAVEAQIAAQRVLFLALVHSPTMRYR